MSHAAFHFRKHLMKKALHSLVMPVVSCNGSEVVEGGFFASSCCGSGKNGGRKKRNESPAAAALHYLQLVKQCEEGMFCACVRSFVRAFLRCVFRLWILSG